MDYSVTAIASKTKNIKLGIGVTCVSFLFRILYTEVQAWTITEKKRANAQDPLDAVRLLPSRSACEGDPAAPGAGKNQPRSAIDGRVANARKSNRGAGSGLLVSARHYLQSIKRSLSLSLSVCLLSKTLTLTQTTDLYARVARAVHASRDPVPYHVHGARARLGNAPHLPALASGRCAWPRMLADSGAATSQRRCKVCLCFPHTPQIPPLPPSNNNK